MQIIIKLKNTDLIEISTDWDTETFGNYTLQETVNTSDIEFKFSNGDKFSMTMKDVDLCHLLGFFYGKDFSKIDSREMCLAFVNYTGAYDLYMNGQDVNSSMCYYFEEGTAECYHYTRINGVFVEKESYTYRHSYWIPTETGVKCSICNNEVDADDAVTMYNCPHCNAQMGEFK